MFVKQWEGKTSVRSISLQSISFEITKKHIVLLKIVKKRRTQTLKDFKNNSAKLGP